MNELDERIKDVLAKAKEDDLMSVQLQFSDLHGMLKAVTIPAEKLEESLTKGTWFDGSSIEGFTRICESDMYLKPDPQTYALLPWEKTPTARLICDVHTPEGTPFEGDPRYILRKALKEAETAGFDYNVGPELEFFLFRPSDEDCAVPLTHDRGGYFDHSVRDLGGDVRGEIVSALTSMGLEVEMSHHEVAPGQHEIDFKYGNALTQADRCMTFKHAVKAVAAKHGLYATFMPKPVYGENGSGMHVHQSLFSRSTGENAFYDAADAYKLSAIAKSFVAGQLWHVRSLIGVLAPTVNSYKRLVPGYEAPVYICWAKVNRSALIRVPRYSPGREKATRCELRCPDPSANPYLAFAVMLRAGLDGMKNNMLPPKPVEEDVYEFDEGKRVERGIGVLPGSLGEAIKELEASRIVKETLGPHTYKTFIKAKKEEWDEYRIQVTRWEHERYFDML